MKKTFLLKTMLLLCALIAGSGTMWGAEYEIVFQSASTDSNSELGASPSVSDVVSSGTDYVASFSSCSKMYVGVSGIKLGASKSTGTMNFTLAANYQANVKSIKVVSAKYGTDSGTLTLYSGNTSLKTGITPGTDYTYTFTTPQTVTSIKLTTSTKRAYITKIVLNIASGPEDLTSFAFATSNPSVQLAKTGVSSWEASYTQTVSFSPTDYAGNISYSIDETSSYPDGWLVDVDDNGEVTIMADTNEDATVVVKASGTADGTNYNAPSDATYSLSVTAAPAGVGTPEFDVATGSYYYGKVVKIASERADKIYYTTDGTTPSKTNGILYDDALGVMITQSMTVKAIGYDFDGETTSDVASIEYTLKNPEVPTISLEAGAVTEGTEVKLTMGEGGTKVVYTTDGNDPTASSTEYTAAIVINGPTTIKAATVDAGGNLSEIVSAAYTIVFVKKEVLWSEDFTGMTSNPSGGTYSYSCSSSTELYTSGTAYAGGELPELLVNGSFSATIPLNNISGTLTLTYKNNNGKISVTSTTTGVTTSGGGYKGDNTVTISGITTSMSSFVIKFSASSNSRLDNIVLSYGQALETTPVKVTAAEYATYSGASALDFSLTDIEAFTATDNVTNVKLNKIESGKVPANTPVVLYLAGADGTPVNVPVIASADAVGDNDLHVSDGTAADDGMYVLSKKNNTVGFYLWDNSNSNAIPAGKIYLKVADSSRSFLSFGEGEITSLSEELRVKSEEYATAPVYNLNGQKVQTPTKGLYIMNGKKVVIK